MVFLLILLHLCVVSAKNFLLPKCCLPRVANSQLACLCFTPFPLTFYSRQIKNQVSKLSFIIIKTGVDQYYIVKQIQRLMPTGKTRHQEVIWTMIISVYGGRVF